MKAAQVGATEAGNNWIGFVIHHAPGPMLAVLPTVEMAKRTSRGRLDPASDELRSEVWIVTRLAEKVLAGRANAPRVDWSAWRVRTAPSAA